MSTKSFSQLKSQLDPDFPLYTLVMFENDGHPHYGFVTGSKKDRYVLFYDKLTEIELTKQRLHGVPTVGFTPEEHTTAKEQTAFFKIVQALLPVDINTLWQQVNGQEKVFHVADLTKNLFGEMHSARYIATRLGLINDRIFFRRDQNGFAPRKLAEIEAAKEKEIARAKKIALFEKTAAVLAKRAKDKDTQSQPIPDEITPTLELLKKAAAGIDFIEDQESAEDLQLLLEAIELKNPGDYRGRTNERAFYPLMNAGILSRRSNLSLIRHNPRQTFPANVLEEAAAISIPTSVSGFSDVAIRQDFTAQQSFTIDDQSTKDMDDALYLEQTSDGYKLFVHITDVAYVIKKDSLLDKEAKLRATSIYCPDTKIAMFPPEISSDKCSLKVGHIRPAITVVFDIDHNYAVVGADITPSLVNIARRLDYNEVDLLLAHHDPIFESLHHIASIHEAQRLEAGATPVVKRDAQPVLADDGTISVEEVDEQSPARALVGEMMVLANIVMANFLQANEIPALYRSQDIPDDDGRDFTKIPAGPARDYAERGRLKRSQVLLFPRYHATLGTNAYIQCTSPIRRFLDLVLQRQIMSFFYDQDPAYSEKDLTSMQPLLDEPLMKAQSISRESKRFWLQLYLEKRCEKRKKITGTIIRVDTKFPMVELDEVYMVVPAKIRNPKLGTTVELTIDKIDPISDFIRFEEAR